MERIPLVAVPNQQVSVLLNNHLWTISTRLGPSLSTLVSVDIDGVTFLQGLKAVAEMPIMFNPRLAEFGQLFFDCADGSSYPEYQLFGSIHNLIWTF